MIPTVDSAGLAEELKGRDPVVVDFFADWCRPCHAMAPQLEALAEARKESVKVVKVDVDASPDVARAYGVMSMPTVIHFSPGGAEAARVVGFDPSRRLDEALRLPARV